ncbi:hypothetical protein B0T16DRAFT_395661 [Cercophora newfieldiana]|uniref:Uncharacterized protein n=1 Tax=Cercophora newfieldiana TaxID=92897 RepID=A0AA39YLV9_9PEZI|nr:hypothetical protein B0T16DRAFT_395661 [Cercophora newfieldiana]
MQPTHRCTPMCQELRSLSSRHTGVLEANLEAWGALPEDLPQVTAFRLPIVAALCPARQLGTR